MMTFAPAVSQWQTLGKANISITQVRPCKHPRGTLRTLMSANPASRAVGVVQAVVNRKCKTLLFDLDGTLYPDNNGYSGHLLKFPRTNNYKWCKPKSPIRDVVYPLLIWSDKGSLIDSFKPGRVFSKPY
jgi:hypothetical protein